MVLKINGGKSRNTTKQYDIEGRELDPLDAAHLKIKTPFIMLACGSDSGMWPKTQKAFEKRAVQAMEKVIKTTPILQTKIVAKEIEHTTSETDQTTDSEPSIATTKTYIYTKHESRTAMPVVKVHFGEYSNEEVTAMIYDLEAKELEYYDRGGSDAANNTPLRIHFVRGKKRAVTLMVWPHSFMDGIGIGICFGPCLSCQSI
jgi:hypothetical protein